MKVGMWFLLFSMIFYILLELPLLLDCYSHIKQWRNLDNKRCWATYTCYKVIKDN